MSEFLEKILACPVCKSKVILTGEGAVCTSSKCRLFFEDNGFLVMLPNYAKQLSVKKHSAIVNHRLKFAHND